MRSDKGRWLAPQVRETDSLRRLNGGTVRTIPAWAGPNSPSRSPHASLGPIPACAGPTRRSPGLVTRSRSYPLGIDEFAFRKGRTYGTVLVDVETSRPVDVLPDRETGSVAAWLQEHPGAEIVCRDRDFPSGRGGDRGAGLCDPRCLRRHGRGDQLAQQSSPSARESQLRA
uniref:transposase n=1 Tax=Streptomyces europaeiscabiei TaxID=146819 RepID=UPI0038D3AC83